MTAAKSPRTTHRPIRAIEHVRTPRLSLKANLLRVATSPAAKVAYIAIGTAGLAALAVAIIGPKRLKQDVIHPIQGRVGEETERLWDESGPLRRQIAGLFSSAASPSGRERLVRSFQSWIGHFHAT
jgi:hypothetical protein